MTMYLPNPDLHATGDEPGEFIDFPTTAHEVTGETRTTTGENERWTATTDSEDMRPTIHDLHHQSTLTDRDGGC